MDDGVIGLSGGSMPPVTGAAKLTWVNAKTADFGHKYYSDAMKRRSTMATSVGALRISTMCERCKTHLVVPEWSEAIAGQETVHIWSCPICGNEFQTIDDRAEPVFSDTELAQEFLPNLMVA